MRFIVLFTGLGVAGGALAKGGWPAKPIRMVVPVTTGGPSDLVARILGEMLAASLGKPVIIENRPGASMVIGSAFVAKSDADGYTLLQAAANLAINPYFMQDIPFDVVKDFAPVSLTHLTPYVFVVSAQSPVMSLQELVASIRHGTQATFGTAGPGSPQQLAAFLLAPMTGPPEKTPVDYKRSSPAHPDLISNRISFMIDPLAASGGHIKAGTLRALAVTTPERNASFPNVPTAIEAGIPGYDFASWGGVFAPARTPREIVLRLNAELGAALASADVRKRFDDMGLVAKHSSPDQFGGFLQSELAGWKPVLADKKA